MADLPREILKEVFGYDSFRPRQEEIIAQALAGRDVLAVMPTGGGKSLCYQIPALISAGTAIVVSPLIALMQDQVSFLRELGLPAAFLNSSMEREDYRKTAEDLAAGRLKLLYAAPETLLLPRIQGLLASIRVSRLCIDEAHCISEWGHDFRPEYRRLSELRALLPAAPCMAFTATATERVREDIARSLGMEDCVRVVSSFDRPNIFLEVLPKAGWKDQALSFVSERPEESGIVYCLSRARVDELAAFLADNGVSALPYHAGLGDQERRENQERFIRDEARVMVATVAFGMGIDKPDVRFVLHVDLPKSLEAYYQEIGRAGRDGLPARARLLYSYGDVRRLSFTFDEKEGPEREAAEEHIRAMVRYAETPSCRRAAILDYFGEKPADRPGEEAGCGACDSCTGAASRADLTVPAHKFLSCVKRTGERFGPGHVIDVLLGLPTERVESLGHGSLSTFGIGTDLSRQAWMSLARQLSAAGYLSVEGSYGVLSLTDKAYASFKSGGPVLLRPLESPAAKKERRRRSEASAGPASRPPALLVGEDLNPDLVQALRGLRTELARASAVPPYVIFSDRTLAELARRKPRTEEALLEVFGMGKAKVAKHGQAICDLIRGFSGD